MSHEEHCYGTRGSLQLFSIFQIVQNIAGMKNGLESMLMLMLTFAIKNFKQNSFPLKLSLKVKSS